MRANGRFIANRGFSIVELMVAITLGLIVLAAVSTVFVSSKANYITQDSMARLQESARVAMHLISRDVRMAGHYGCVDDVENINNVLAGDGGFAFDFEVAVEGTEGDTGLWYPSNVATNFPASGTSVTSKVVGCPNYVGGKCTGTDAIAVRMADSSSIALTAAMPNTAAALFVAPNSGLRIGDVVLVADCGSADLFQITNVQAGTGGNSGRQAIVHNGGNRGINGEALSPGNKTPAPLGRTYSPPGAGIMKFVQRAYYVGTGASGQPALFRQNLDGSGREELVEGIQDMQVSFGTATSGDRTPRMYLPANDGVLGADPTRWTNVVSARVTFTSRPVTEGAPKVEPKLFTSTFLMRNLQ
ncbi:MAG: PilW family protein [Gammaproteobacteria bacterium]